MAFLEMTVAGLRVVMEVAERRPNLIRAIKADEALTKIVAAWPTLPEPIRRAMLAPIG